MTSRELPCSMCPGCKYYEFYRANSDPHICKDSGSFSNSSKIGGEPGTGKTTCRTYESRS